MHCCIMCDCCIIYGAAVKKNSPCIIHVMNELTVINGLTCCNESVTVHQAYLLFRLNITAEQMPESVLLMVPAAVVLTVEHLNAPFIKVGIYI